MIRVRIQLPEDIHARAKSLAAAKQVSLDELARRGLELVLALAPDAEDIGRPWESTRVKGLGWKGLTHSEIRDAAQRSTAEEKLEQLACASTRVGHHSRLR